MSARRLLLADTAAMLGFFTLAGALNERLVAGMAWDEVARARLVGAAAMLLTARPYGMWRDACLPRLAGRAPGPLRLLLADTAALLLFQVPLYAAILLAGGAEVGEALRGTAGAAAVRLVSGRPYGLWLDLVRRWLRAAPRRRRLIPRASPPRRAPPGPPRRPPPPARAARPPGRGR